MSSDDYHREKVNILRGERQLKVKTIERHIEDRSSEESSEEFKDHHWSGEISTETPDVIKSNVTISPDLTFMARTDAASNSKRVLPQYIANQIKLPENRERIYYSPIISRDLHPWFYMFIRWTSGPLSLASSTFNLILKYLLFWRNKGLNQEVINMYESDLMEILTANLFLPNYETGSVSFFIGTFEEAVVQAKHDYKMLLVYLHRLGNSEADNFLCFSLLNSQVINLLNDPENILIWAGHLSNKEGKEVSYIFNTQEPSSENTIQYVFNPFIKLFDCPEAPFLFSLLTITLQNGSLKLSVVGQLEKLVNDLDLSNILKNWIEIGSRPRLIAKREKTSQAVTADLRKEQEKAFNDMLERDRLKEQLIQLEVDKRTLLIEMKKDLLKQLMEMQEQLENEENQTISVLIKMHNGRRFNWNFSLNSSVKYLYYLVFSQEDSPKDFELLWNYPQKVLNGYLNLLNSTNIYFGPQKNDPQSFKELGLIRNEAILVRDLNI